jgi:hypothetical protein
MTPIRSRRSTKSVPSDPRLRARQQGERAQTDDSGSSPVARSVAEPAEGAPRNLCERRIERLTNGTSANISIASFASSIAGRAPAWTRGTVIGPPPPGTRAAGASAQHVARAWRILVSPVRRGSPVGSGAIDENGPPWTPRDPLEEATRARLTEYGSPPVAPGGKNLVTPC